MMKVIVTSVMGTGTRLDVDPDEIRDATGRFVDLCALARLHYAEVDGRLPETGPIDGVGRDVNAEG